MSVGKRIKVARLANGLSLRDLKVKIDNRVSAQAISKYERDESKPSSNVIVALAEALDVSESHLTDGGVIHLESVDFRKRPSTSSLEESQVKASVLSGLQRYLEIEEILGLPTISTDLPREVPWPVFNDVAESEQAAQALRAIWGLGNDPIPNLVDLLEERGIKIFALKLLNIDGLATRVRDEKGTRVWAVVVNSRGSGERQRFTLAHELGHMALEVHERVDEEKAARRFASALLLPAESIRVRIGKHRTSVSIGELVALKRIFGVSIEALTHRCKDLGIFDPPLFRLLLQEFRKRGWSRSPFKEPGKIEVETPKRFERLCFRALAEDAITLSQAVDLLRISKEKLIRRMNSE